MKIPQEKNKFNYKKIFAIVGLFVLLLSCLTYIDRNPVKYKDILMRLSGENAIFDGLKAEIRLNGDTAKVGQWFLVGEHKDIGKAIELYELGVTISYEQNNMTNYYYSCEVLLAIYSGKYGEEFKDIKKFRHYLRGWLLAKKDAQAILRYGARYLQENDICGKDITEAIVLLEKAFALGAPEASIVLNKIYWGLADKTAFNPEKAFYWAQKAALASPAIGKQQLAMSYWYGIGVSVDKDKAIKLLKEAAALGNTEAAETLNSLK